MEIGSRLRVIGIIALATSTSAITAALVVRLPGPSAAATPAKEKQPSAVIIERQVVIREDAPRTDQPTSTVTTSAKEPAPPQAAARVPVTQAEMAETAVDAFDSDGPASAESQKRETRIRDILTDRSLDGVRLERVECRASVCQLETSLANPVADAQVFQRLMVGIVKDNMSLIIPTRITNADGSIRATAYLFAPGSVPPVSSSG